METLHIYVKTHPGWSLVYKLRHTPWHHDFCRLRQDAMFIQSPYFNSSIVWLSDTYYHILYYSPPVRDLLSHIMALMAFLNRPRLKFCATIRFCSLGSEAISLSSPMSAQSVTDSTTMVIPALLARAASRRVAVTSSELPSVNMMIRFSLSGRSPRPGLQVY